MKISSGSSAAKQNTVKITLILSILILGIVGYYAYLSNNARSDAADQKMTAIESALSRKMDTDYPSTPKEVIKYYNEITKCLYNEEPTDEQTTMLVERMRELFDDELLEENSLVKQLSSVKEEQKIRIEKKMTIAISTVTASTNVEYFTKNKYDCASITSDYTIRAGNEKVSYTNQYILRRDENKRWKIYGWVTKE